MNRLKKSLVIGTLMIAPVLSAGSAFAASSCTVQGNDTMYRIAVKNGISLAKLEQANPQIANFDIIWPGMVIHIPSTGGSAGAPAADQSNSSYASQVVQKVNQQRASAGLSPLTVNQNLTAMALEKAKDMYNNNYFDHNSPTYGSPFTMMNSFGIKYSTAGENIAKGQQNPTEVMNAWMNSSGHKANILNGKFTQIGVAYYNGEWVQEFIG